MFTKRHNLSALLPALAASALLCLLPTLGRAADTTLRVVGLRCEMRTDPLGVDVSAPTLEWHVASDERGQKQSAYRILVASSREALEQGRGDLWDSGRVASGETLHHRYTGTALSSSARVYWRVQAWDRTGQPTPWSEIGTWTMGLLQLSDWKGVWIAAPGATESLLLRREFTVRPGLRRAIAHVSGLGQYELHLNGQKAGNDLLSPGWTAYDHTVLYDTRDVTDLLHAGPNAVGMILGNGMYNVVRRDRFVKFTGSFGPLRAILHLRLEYADGSTETVGTDTTWRCDPGPITFNNIYGGEDFDARRDPTGWDRPGYDASRWLPAIALVRAAGTLRGLSASALPLRVIETRKPVAVHSFPDHTVVYDLGQNAACMPRLVVKGPAGSTVRLIPAEVVTADGTISTATMGGSDRGGRWWQYTKATDGEETWSPRFCYVGCRYLKAEFFPPAGASRTIAYSAAALPTLLSLEGQVVHADAVPLGQFAASNPLLNRIRDLVRWAQRSNMVSVLTDCPHREKLGWLEQYHLNGPAIRYEFDVAPIFAKGMHDMADAQADDGLIPTTAPEYAKFKGTFRAAAEWGAAFFLVPWQQYEFTGDTDLLRTHYEAMKRYFAYLQTRADVGDILSEGLGDWYDLGPKKPGVAQLTPPPITATAFYYNDARLLAQIAALLGKDEDARAYAARADRIRDHYNQSYFHTGAGNYATNSQCANALPLVMAIAPEKERERVLASLTQDLESRGCAMTAGDVGFRYLLQALAEGGRSDLVYRMIDQDEKPGYGYQLKKGETSLTEAWDANGSSSHNHFMLGQITEWFYRDLAGIDTDPAAPGFQNIRLRPSPVGDLTWVEADYNSVHGPIHVRWEHSGDRFTLKTSVPANTTATLFLPARSGAAIQEGGAPVADRPGIRFLRTEGDRAVFALESGSYIFTSQLGGAQ